MDKSHKRQGDTFGGIDLAFDLVRIKRKTLITDVGPGVPGEARVVAEVGETLQLIFKFHYEISVFAGKFLIRLY
jgi:hypothetical protein